MNAFTLVISSLKERSLNSFLSVMLTALGVMLAVVIILFSGHLETRLGKNAQGIDFVVGAKGSPLQLILSSVYHIDIPTGNIPYKEAERWMKHKQVQKAIPLALGDSYKSFRIVGTSADYIALYNGQIKEGRLWSKPFEAVAGSATGLEMGKRFVGAHGLMRDGHNHDESPYTVTGVLKATGTVLDRLILTSTDSVLLIHGMEAQQHHDHGHEEHKAVHTDERHGHEHGHHHESHDERHKDKHHGHGHAESSEAEITALLIKARSPVAIMNLPRQINHDTNLLAAVPSYEMARLTSMLGLGSKTALALSVLLVGIAGLSIFSGIAGTLENRLYDLVVMRTLGFSSERLFRLILGESLLLVAFGFVIGVLLGHLAFYALIQTMEPLQGSGATAAYFDKREAGLAVFILLAGIAAALVPALRAARLDVGNLLSKGV